MLTHSPTCIVAHLLTCRYHGHDMAKGERAGIFKWNGGEGSRLESECKAAKKSGRPPATKPHIQQVLLAKKADWGGVKWVEFHSDGSLTTPWGGGKWSPTANPKHQRLPPTVVRIESHSHLSPTPFTRTVAQASGATPRRLRSQTRSSPNSSARYALPLLLLLPLTMPPTLSPTPPSPQHHPPPNTTLSPTPPSPSSSACHAHTQRAAERAATRLHTPSRRRARCARDGRRAPFALRARCADALAQLQLRRRVRVDALLRRRARQGQPRVSRRDVTRRAQRRTEATSSGVTDCVARAMAGWNRPRSVFSRCRGSGDSDRKYGKWGASHYTPNIYPVCCP
jgi:hypothetical protein